MAGEDVDAEVGLDAGVLPFGAAVKEADQEEEAAAEIEDFGFPSLR